jgi:glycerophosphoryl diester phosphodiesterase
VKVLATLLLVSLLGCAGDKPAAPDDTGGASTPPTSGSMTAGTGGTGAGTTPTGTPPGSTGDTGPTTETGTGTGSAATETGDTAVVHTGDTAPPPPPCLPRVIAHRGASALAPEDTLGALELAFATGARMAEVDVRVAADGRAYLLHDTDLARTTREIGPAIERSLAELQAIDAGRWHGEAWAGEHVPSLVDALLLADRYDAVLYLDLKMPAADAVVDALETSGVGTETIHLSLGDPFQLEEFRAALPDAAATWWGGIPETWGEPAFDADMWFDSLAAANVSAVEFDWPTVITDERFTDYADACRDRGLEVWTFTVNEREAMHRAVDELGLDGIETDYPGALHDIVCEGGDGGPLPEHGMLATWSFTDGLFPAGDGSQLVAIGGLEPTVGSTTDLGLPDLPDGPAPVLRVPRPDRDSGVRVFPNAMHFELGDGLAINTWTLVIDLLRPPSAEEGWIPLIQTNHLNENDAEVYLRPGDGGLGVLEQYHGEVPVNTWHRLVVAVDTSAGDAGLMWLYIDGEPTGEVALEGGVDGRFSLNSTWAYSEALLFTDAGDFTSDVVVGSLQLHDRALTPDEAAALGGASAAGIPE